MATITSFVDGKAQTCLALNDRGFNYGHGLFETMRLSAGQIPLWAYHRQRLALGADRLAIALDSPCLERYLQQALEAFPAEGLIKLVLTAGEGPRGYRHAGQSARYVLQYFPPVDPPTAAPVAVRLQLCDYILQHNGALAGIKHLNRLDQVMAAASVDEGFDGLLVDVDGNVVEALSSNIFLYDGRRWLTPALDQCGVAGVMRAFLCDTIFPELGHQVVVEHIDMPRLRNAHEVFVCNSVRGIQSVLELEGLAHWSLASSSTATQQVIDYLASACPCFAA